MDRQTYYISLCRELVGYCIVVSARNEIEARKHAVKYFGKMWCSVYSSAGTMKVIGGIGYADDSEPATEKFRRCERCDTGSQVHICSMFNTEMICMECKDKEIKHPMYKVAQDAENAAVRMGNFGFEGIGKPDDL